MKLLRDPLGRPIKRVYFEREELDERCERIAAEFMDQHSGGFGLPIPTDDLIRMIESVFFLREIGIHVVPTSFSTESRGC
ncbi:MAG: hypothetical protein IVW56_01170 [Candidatus Binataceae bacterium]|nr:hypothetical protein [Candidatus Binataceae bacterium]